MSTEPTSGERHARGEIPPGKHLFEETVGLTDWCVRCQTDLQTSAGVGCEAAGINPAYYCGLALTAAEQMAAEVCGWDVDDAMTHKILALCGTQGPAPTEELIPAREAQAARYQAALVALKRRAA